jgi:hypothetical protein
LLDPVNNIICGINAFADCRDQAVDFGLDKEGREVTIENFGVALAMYNQGPRGRTATQYSKDVLSAAKKYRELGL